MTRPCNCPHCKSALHLAEDGATQVCGTCRGTFCDRDTLKRLIAEALQSPELRDYERPKLSLKQAASYVPCPMCAELMNRRNFAGSSGVVVDVCTHDGVWFDDGELAQVLLFCGSGELVKSERFEENRSRARRDIQSFQSQLDVATPRHYFSPLGVTLDAAIIVDVLNNLDRTFASPIGSPRPDLTAAPEPDRKLTREERLIKKRSQALHQEVDKVVQRVLVAGGTLVGAVLGLLFAPQFQASRHARRLGIDPVGIRPAIIVIAVFAIIGGIVGWRAARTPHWKHRNNRASSKDE